MEITISNVKVQISNQIQSSNEKGIIHHEESGHCEERSDVAISRDCFIPPRRDSQ
jgi:hypothetical protein